MTKKIFTEQSPLKEVIASYNEAADALIEKSEKLATAEKSIEGLQADLKTASETIADISKKLDAKAAEVSSATPVIEIKKEKYYVTIPKFNYEGKDYTADDLKTNKELAEELLAGGFGGLQLVRDRNKS